MPNGHRLYTSDECETIRRLFPDCHKISKILGRSFRAVRAKAYNLSDLDRPRRHHRWTADEILKLRYSYKRLTTDELKLTYALDDLEPIYKKAFRMKLRRARRQPKLTGDRLLDAVRSRCWSIGYSLKDLDEMLGYSYCFVCSTTQFPNAKRLYRAVKYLEGSVNRDGTVTWR